MGRSSRNLEALTQAARQDLGAVLDGFHDERNGFTAQRAHVRVLVQEGSFYNYVDARGKVPVQPLPPYLNYL